MRLCLLSTPSSGTDAALSISLACFAVVEIPLDDVYERVEASISLPSDLSNSAVVFLSVLNQLGHVSTVFLNMERQVHYRRPPTWLYLRCSGAAFLRARAFFHRTLLAAH